jgi:hypothetical protein
MSDDDDDIEQVAFSEEDFIIRVRPQRDRKGKFDGEASFSVISSSSSDLPYNLYKDIEYVVRCMLSTVPLMELDEDFRKFVFDYVDTRFEYEFEDGKPDSAVKDVDGNVITIDFGTNTKGNA